MTMHATGARQHADMAPAMRARVDAQAGLGRALAAYAEANVDLGRGDVNPPYVERRRSTVETAVEALIAAAIAEGREAAAAVTA